VNERLLRWWREEVISRYATATIGNAVWLGSSTAVNGVFGAIGAAIIARALGVEEFGVLSLVVSVMTLLEAISDLGLSSALTRFGSEAVAAGDLPRVRRLASIVFRWRWSIAAVVLLLSLLFVRPLMGYFFTQVDARIEFLFKVSLFGVVFATLGGTFTALYQSFKEFRTQALLSIGRGATKVLLIVLFVYLLSQASLTWMLLAEVLSAFVFFVAGYVFLPIRGLDLRSKDEQAQRQVVRFARWIALSQVFAMLATRIDLALLGALSDATNLGLYSAAQKVIGLMTVAVVSYSSVLFIEMSSAPTPAGLSQKRKESFAVVGAVIVGIALAALLADPIIPILFGEKFAGAIPAFRVMCVGLAFVVGAFPTNGTLFARNRSFAFPVMSGTSIAILVPANMLLVPAYGSVGAAIAYTLGTGGAFVVSVGLALFLKQGGVEARTDV
jgi:O-antigen/teichoic acid export membrane protein